MSRVYVIRNLAMIHTATDVGQLGISKGHSYSKVSRTLNDDQQSFAVNLL